MKKRTRETTLRTQDSLTGLAFLTPWIIGLVVFTLYPIGYSMMMSVSNLEFKIEGGIQATFAGMEMYRKIFTEDAHFIPALLKTLKFIAFSTPMILVSSVILAMLLNKVPKGKGFFRALFFFPVVVISGPVMSKLIGNDATMLIQAGDYGVYQIIKGLPEIISTPLLYVFDNVVLILWYSGVQILIILAGLQKINKPIYEAAAIDGASGWQIFWKITFPHLRPMILLCGIYTVVDLAAMPSTALAKLVSDNVERTDMMYSYSAALSWLYTIVVLITLGVVFLLLKERKEKHDD